MKCLSCSNEFEVKRSTAKYCSAKCRKLAFQQNGKGNAKLELRLSALQSSAGVLADKMHKDQKEIEEYFAPTTTTLSDRELLAHWAAGNGTPYQQDLGMLAEQYRVIEAAKHSP